MTALIIGLLVITTVMTFVSLCRFSKSIKEAHYEAWEAWNKLTYDEKLYFLILDYEDKKRKLLGIKK